jgi:exopolysaccharide production protein ExoZ
MTPQSLSQSIGARVYRLPTIRREDAMDTVTRATPTRPASAKLVGVQAARGVAVLMVVIYHTTRSLSLPQYLGHIPFDNAFGFGHAGVDFFFVLSGFIITHAHAADVGRPERLYRYLWRRLTRIYPTYWLVTGIELVRPIFSPAAGLRLTQSRLLHSLLLLPDNSEPLVGVAWTLRSEMLFYFAFVLPIIDRRFGKPLIIGALLLILTGVFIAPADPWFGLLVASFNIEFLFGIAAAMFLSRRHVPRPAAFVTVGIVLFLATGAMEVIGWVPLNGLTGRTLYGGASAAILLGLVELERQGGNMRLGAAGVMLGDASYCLYLLHLSVIPLVVRIGAHFGVLSVLPVGILVTAVVVLSLVVAVTFHVWVELPMTQLIRRHTPRACR